jgi:methionyl-tRNA formyltransferase
MEETGVTAMYMAAGMDTGDMIEIRRTPIDPDENAQSLLDRLAQMGGPLLCDTLDAMEEGRTTRTPQDDSKATFAPMLTKELCPIDWSRSPRQIRDHVRGLDPWPVATTMIQGKRFKIYEVCPSHKTTDKAPGTFLAVTKEGLEVACGEGGVLVITRLQAEGGKRMGAPDYFRGHPLELP